MAVVYIAQMIARQADWRKIQRVREGEFYLAEMGKNYFSMANNSISQLVNNKGVPPQADFVSGGKGGFIPMADAVIS